MVGRERVKGGQEVSSNIYIALIEVGRIRLLGTNLSDGNEKSIEQAEEIYHRAIRLSQGPCSAYL